MTRGELLNQLAQCIAAIPLEHPTRVAIDGVDGAGKTVLANELIAPIERCGRQVIRASIDGFHRPQAERYRRGADSPEGYYHDSFDDLALGSVLLKPLGANGNREYRRRVFDYRTDQPVNESLVEAKRDAILLFDGVFLFRPELNDYWDYRIFVQADFDFTIARAVQRDEAHGGDAAEIERRYRNRYIPGQQLYLQFVRPQELANAIVENNDPQVPQLILQNP